MEENKENRKGKILMEVAKLCGPTSAMILRDLIEESKDAAHYILEIDNETKILFQLNHESMRKKYKLKSTAYWYLVQKLIDKKLVKKHVLKLKPLNKLFPYIEFGFQELDNLLSNSTDEVVN